MFGLSFLGRKFTPFRGLDATADKESGQISYTCVSLWQKSMPEEERFWRVDP
jgi:hypothetical protein